jgi:SpoIID/LytB domain protein
MGPPILDRDGARADVFNRLQMLRMDATYHRPAALPGHSTRSNARPILAFLAILLGALAVAAAPANAASSTLVIEGTGDGHGVGMSQDGAYGYARHGYDYQQILAHYYTGTTLGQAARNAVVKVLVGSKVKRVPLERYVRGVVAAEMPSGWPMAALEAQAVASRTYALTDHAGGSRFDVYSDTRSQVYEGTAAETAASNAAIAATAGQIVEYAGKPAITYFFASSGGMTEDVQYGFPGAEAQPWLIGVDDAYEGSSARWTVEMSMASAAKRLRGLFKGSFRGIEVLKRGTSPRILTARVLGSTGSSQVQGPELAGLLGLNSTWEYFSVRSGSALHAEPDRSGRTKVLGPTGPTLAPPTPPSTTPTGGIAPAPGAEATATASASGGTAAG